MFKIAGSIPVVIYPFFWVLAALIGWMNTNSVEGTAIWALIILISVLVHEYGHALTAIAFGQKARIELMGFGGLTLRSGKTLKRWQEFIIIINGPLAGFLLAWLAWLVQSKLILTHPQSIVTYGVVIAFYVNVFWTIINLLPVQPMDGGKLMSILLEWLFGNRGLKIAHVISLMLASGLGIYFMSLGSYLAGSLFFIFAYESYITWKASAEIHEHDMDESIIRLLGEVDQYAVHGPGTNEGRRDDAWAIRSLEEIRNLTKKGVLYIKATELLGKFLGDRGDIEGAFNTLRADKDKLSPTSFCYLQLLASRLERWDEVAALGDQAYRDLPNYQTALTNAMAYAILGKSNQSVGWLRCAAKEGLPNMSKIIQMKEFDRIRDEPIFKEFALTVQ